MADRPTKFSATTNTDYPAEMIVDSSALLAILQDEPEGADFIAALERSDRPKMSAASWLETSIVIGQRYGPEGLLLLDRFITAASIQKVAFDEDQATAARNAFRDYGKGNHPAGLNFGDCFAYACAKVLGEPILFKGNDFTKTDLTPVNLSPGS